MIKQKENCNIKLSVPTRMSHDLDRLEISFKIKIVNYSTKVMENEFKYQIKFINYCGILESPSKKWRSFFKILQIFNVLVNIYCLITLITFMAENYSNILEISECMAPVITTIMALMKFSLLYFFTDDIFDLIREIRMLNRKCKGLFTNNVH